ncbi:hypothetical protein CRE_12966 [Caenorhabditis remanei]|uniref:G-protein coupled receptors family 1 profile domain-containing protein n=1 Tax=Caenorhabditis remanei TaxID=31234 RepID=E3N107_CAERE|nr:hypothetical protein CRE_12966 [Caenorhabditis remanei]
MKTTKALKTTTEFFDEDYFIYGHRNDYTEDFFFEGFKDIDFRSNVAGALMLFEQIYDVAAYVNLFINFPHLIILLQKELRTNLVYIIMFGVCICDLMHSIGKIAAISMTWDIFYTYENCPTGLPYFHVVINILSKTLQVTTRRCSAFLALFIAAFRSFSVIFPMSNAVNFLMKAKSAYLIVLFFGLISSGWGNVYFYLSNIDHERECKGGVRPVYATYRFRTGEKWEVKYRFANGVISVVIGFLYIFVTAALVIALIAANKRRKNLKNEKPSNTSMMVILMAVSLFCSECAYGGIFIASLLVFNDYAEQSYLEDMEVLALTFSMVNSATHCLICFLMSSQYRNTVKRLLHIGVKEKEVKVKVAVVESSAHPTTVDTSNTSGSSKKAY